jgi:predicted DsbA family dithiol-disulfide isomerase
MPRLVVAHDVVCPWCYVARIQAHRLREAFPGLEFEWKGYELLPAGMTYTPAPPDPEQAQKPRIPSRFELLLAADGITLPKRESGIHNSRLALEGAEFAASAGRVEAYLDALYHAYWEEDRDISDKAVLTEIAESAGLDIAAFIAAIEDRRYRNDVVEFDEPAHAAGIWNVPTWKFPEEWVAEQPYSVLHEMAARFMTNPA